MKYLVSAVLVAAQLAATAQPAFAAEVRREATAATGTFGGLRLRMPLGGTRAERAPHLGLAFAPTLHSMGESGEAHMRIGEGLELGLSERRPTLGLSIAGRRLGAAQGENSDENEDDDGGIDTGEALLIAGGVLVLAAGAGLIWLVDAMNDASE